MLSFGLIRSVVAAAALVFALPAARADEPARVAYFGLLLIDMSAGTASAAEEARREVAEVQIAETLAESGRYAFVDTAPVAAKAALYSNLAHCNGCDAALAQELGADLALTAEIQKTSNLILSISIYLRDAKTGALIGGGSADIRGNTDESWRRGVAYILKHRILKP